MARIVLTSLLLAVFWMLWSGHTEPFMLILGVFSVAISVALGHRMKVIDEEGYPFQIALRLLAYLPWLVWQIILANAHVARVILTPSLPIQPQLIRIHASQRTVIGQVIHANSITITPGTISLELRDGMLLVHALTDQTAAEDATEVVDKRVSRIEGEHS